MTAFVNDAGSAPRAPGATGDGPQFESAGPMPPPATESAPPATESAPPAGGSAPPGGGSTPPGYGATWQPRRLYRSTDDRVVAGVCGGLAEHFAWDPAATRIGFAVLTVLSGIFPMLILYIVMAIVIPNGPDDVPMPRPASAPAEWTRRRRARRSGAGYVILGVLLIAGGATALLNRYFSVDWDLYGPAVAIGLGFVVLLLALTRRQTDA